MNTNEIEKLLAAATPGPWRKISFDWSVDCDGDASWCHVGKPKSKAPVAIVTVTGAYGNDRRLDANSALIALAPDLAAEVLRLLARIAALEAVVAAGDGLAEAAQNMADYGTVLDEQKYHRNLDTALTTYRAAKEASQ